MARYTQQQAFDIAYKGLKAQGCKSLTIGSGCAYRGGEGRKCAIGMLLTDEDMQVGKREAGVVSIEGSSPSSWPRLASEIVDGTNPVRFLTAMQEELHDNLSPTPYTFNELLEVSAKDFAKEHNLTLPED